MREQLKHKAQHMLRQVRDQKLRLAVTGLSRAGKTAFVTSLVDQLLHGGTPQNLPLWPLAAQQRLHTCEVIAQRHLQLPAFPYLQSKQMLCQQQWPQSTHGLSEICLKISYFESSGRLRYLYLDILDYPGEWLLDLPMLELSYEQWCAQQWQLFQQPHRWPWCQPWLEVLGRFRQREQLSDAEFAEIATAFGEMLAQLKSEHGASLLQPGRRLNPGDLRNAPILDFFPVPPEWFGSPPSWLEQLQKRYHSYVRQLIRPFYRDYFCRYDRQLVLVDCLTALNHGHAHFQEMLQAIQAVLKSFRYGTSGRLTRLFKPKIERICFAASKADHVTPEQWPQLVALLRSVTQELTQTLATHIAVQHSILASVRTTQAGTSKLNGETLQTLKGQLNLNDEPVVMFPGDVPACLPQAEFFTTHHFNFHHFIPPQLAQVETALPHLGMDRLIRFLLHDRSQ